MYLCKGTSRESGICNIQVNDTLNFKGDLICV
jgi:hypothetical protein